LHIRFLNSALIALLLGIPSTSKRDLSEINARGELDYGDC